MSQDCARPTLETVLHRWGVPAKDLWQTAQIPSSQRDLWHEGSYMPWLLLCLLLFHNIFYVTPSAWDWQKYLADLFLISTRSSRIKAQMMDIIIMSAFTFFYFSFLCHSFLPPSYSPHQKVVIRRRPRSNSFKREEWCRKKMTKKQKTHRLWNQRDLPLNSDFATP